MRRSSGIEFVKAEKSNFYRIGINNSVVNTIFYKRKHECFCKITHILWYIMFYLLVLIINIFDQNNVFFFLTPLGKDRQYRVPVRERTQTVQARTSEGSNALAALSNTVRMDSIIAATSSPTHNLAPARRALAWR